MLESPRIQGVIETCLYVADLGYAIDFYERILLLRRLVADDRMAALAVADRQLLLLFRKGATPRPIPTSGGVIPAGHGDSPVHLGLAIDRRDLAASETWLEGSGVSIESRVEWPRGGWSLYFRDPDRNLVELLTPGVWTVY